MPRRKTARRKRAGARDMGELQNLKDEFSGILRNLEQAKSTGVKPSESQLWQIHHRLDRFLPEVDAIQSDMNPNLQDIKQDLTILTGRLFELLEQVHDLPAGGFKARSRRKTRRAGSSRP